MPRGPGKRSNYNLDYSRFNGIDRKEEPEEEPVEEVEPDVAAALRNMPPELQEAYRLTMLSRATGDEAAQRRANELALQAVDKGGPEVRENFMKEISAHLPEGALKGMENLQSLDAELPRADSLEDSAETLAKRIDGMKAQMEAGREATRRQLDALQQQQDSLEKISSPDDFVNFMTKEGLSQEDLQRMLTGDPKQMEEMVARMLNKAADPGEDAKKLAGAEAAIKHADELHSRICGNSADAGNSKPLVQDAAVEKVCQEAKVFLPNHRLQYQKDDEGRYTAMELICELPGVSDMSCIVLDIAEKHLRLNTIDPAPKYAVNAGPFPVLIEPAGAKAKFSRKRRELSVSVPAKA
mmetsp:Transcript_64400/g.151298  ORF Transcript_64400/g.151298 Transcript_64400/m.151298 type:complete len:353 (+) Transcript_64400:58-1116(+)